MRELIENFPNQIKEAGEALKNQDSNLHDSEAKDFAPDGVLILGMGGSGIGGAFISSILRKNSSIPIQTNPDYCIPGWVSENTLVVACSNSGNTEETIEAAFEAQKRNATITCVTSGGKLEEYALEKNWPLVKVPAGLPPRSQFGHSLLSLAWTLVRFGIFPENLYSDLEATHKSTKEFADHVVERAEAVADLVEGKSIHIYSDTHAECITTRWRQQLNENSKILVNSMAFPELNHNELVGWADGGENDVVIILRTPEDYTRTQTRMVISAEIFQEMGSDVIFIDPDGENQMQRLMYLVFLGDHLSLILAERAGVDPVEIDNIIRLKNRLAEI